MAGTRAGGKKAAVKNLAKNPNFYRDIGRIGGRAGKTGSFVEAIACDCKEYPDTHLLRKCAGRKGGRISKPGVRNKEGYAC